MKNRFAILLLIMELCFLTAIGNDVIKNPKPVPVKDSSAIEVRRLSNEALARFRNQQDFIYGSTYQSADSLWARFWRGFWSFLESIFSDQFPAGAVKVISLLALGGLLIFIILKFSGISIFQLIGKTPASVVHSNSENGENIHEINFDEEIASAIKSEYYRLAVRMLYLKTLKQLSDRSLISWSIDKTNFEYVQELDHPQHQQEFRILTQSFEYIWYGEFNLNHSAFTEMREEYNRFNNLLI